MKICEICNHENNDRSCFCEKCGAQFPVDSKTREEIFCIVKNANLGISNKPIFYPDLDKKIKEKLLKHFDTAIVLDSFIGIFDTSLINKSCNNGLVFMTTGFYALEAFGKPTYVNYSDIECMTMYPDKKGRKDVGDAKLQIRLKNEFIVTIENTLISNKPQLKVLLEELKEYVTKNEINELDRPSGVIGKKELPEKEKKRCNIIIHSASVACGAVGVVPVAGIAASTPIQIGMITALAANFGIKISKEYAKSILISLSSVLAGRAVAQFAFFIPIVGIAINTATAAGLTELIGWIIADRFYNQQQANKALYEMTDKQKGYVYASTMWENKLRTQAEQFKTKEIESKKQKEYYEQLLSDYEEYIKELESKVDASDGDKASCEEMKKEYGELKQLGDNQ